jgi:hypothetical protein
VTRHRLHREAQHPTLIGQPLANADLHRGASLAGGVFDHHAATGMV